MKKYLKILLVFVASFGLMQKASALDYSLDGIKEKVTETYNNVKDYYNNNFTYDESKPRRTDIEYNRDVYLKDGNAGFDVGLDIDILRNEFYFNYLYDFATNLDLRNGRLDINYDNDLTIDLHHKELDHLEVVSDPIEMEEGSIPDLSSATVYKVYTNGEKEIITDYTYSKDRVTMGMTSIEISYTEGGITKNANVPIVVKAKTNENQNTDPSSLINNLSNVTANTSTVANPKTADNIINYILLALLSLISLIIISKKRTKMSN